MYCPYCKQEVPDNAAFCANCGYPLTERSVQTNNQGSENFQNENYVPQNENFSQDSHQYGNPNQFSDVANQQGNAVSYEQNWSGEQVYNANLYNQPVKPKKSKKKLALIISLSAVLLVISIVGIYILTVLNGPLARIARAANKTMESESFSASFKLTEGNNTNKGKIQAQWNLEKREITLYCDITESDGDTYTFTLKDGILAEKSTYGTSTYYNYEDVSDELDEMFEAYEDNKDKDFDDFFTEEFLEEYIGEDATEEICDVVDLQKLKKATIAYAKKLNDSDWLEENAGFEKEKADGVTYFSFSPDFSDFTKASLEGFEEAFKDKDDFDDGKDALVELAKQYDKSFSLSGEIGIKGGVLHSASFKCKEKDDGDVIKGEITFEDVGETTVSSSKADDLISEAKAYKESRNSGYYY